MKYGEMLNLNNTVLVFFYLENHDLCKELAPIIKAVAYELGEKARVLKVDVDRNPELSDALRIITHPTVIIYKLGIKKFQKSGKMTKKEILKELK